MTQRERVLLLVLIAVGGVGVLMGGYLAYSTVTGWAQSGKNRIAGLEKQLAEKKRLVAQTEAARRKIADWQKRSLPPEPSHASALYSDWLLERVVQAGFVAPKVVAANQRPERDLGMRLIFTVGGNGTLRQIVDLLHEFYSVDHLHRITLMKIVPTKEPKQLSFTLTVEALSLLGAPEAEQLTSRWGNRLEMPSLEDYSTAILNRNLFGPPNQAPQLSGLGNQRAETGRAITDIIAKASDPDPDKFTYKLEKSAAQDARLDASSGAFRWTPRRTGVFEFVISVTDDGIPAKTTTERLVVTVSDPVTPPPTPALAFDEAKFTVLAAVIDKGGTGEVWLHIRPRDGNNMLKLGIGDSFEVGSVKGTVKSIDVSHFVFESDGKLKRLDSGEALVNAEAEPQ